MSKKLTDCQKEQAAKEFGIEPAILKAILEVESGGSGYFTDGKIKILFEPHWMWRRLWTGKNKQGFERKIDPAKLNAYDWTLCHSPHDWNDPAPDGKRNKGGGLMTYAESARTRPSYDRLNKIIAWASLYAKEKHPTSPTLANELFQEIKSAAYESCSWGLPQIMGFHYAKLGFESVYHFKQYMEASEANQLKVMLDFLKLAGLKDEMQEKNWVEIARYYNGAAAVKKYAPKLKAAYLKHGGVL